MSLMKLVMENLRKTQYLFKQQHHYQQQQESNQKIVYSLN